MSIGKRIKALRTKHGYTQDHLAARLHMNRANFSNYERDIAVPPGETLLKIADMLGTSTDYLLSGRSEQTPPYFTLTGRDEHDIAHDLARIMNSLESNETLAFYGEELDMDEEAKTLLKLSIEQSMRLAKQMAKKTYTPHKYRN